MNGIQTKKNTINCGKCISTVVVLALVISGGILGYFWSKKETVPNPTASPTPSVSPPTSPALIPIPTPPLEVWETYNSTELGFSIKYPQMVYGVYRCSPNKPFWVPLKVFEDKENGIVYITEEYYYDNWDSGTQTNTGPCEKIINSLESLKKEKEENIIYINDKIRINGNPFLTKAITTKDVGNDNELKKFIKDTYGSGCYIENKKQWKQDVVYEIEIKGEDWKNGADLETTICPINYIYKVLYAPGKNKVMSVNLGQDCGFGTDYNLESYKCYDEEIINSFEFK